MSVPFSLVLDGTDTGTNAILGTADNLSAFSVSIWMKATSPASNEEIIGKINSAPNYGWFIWLRAGGDVFFQMQPTGGATSLGIVGVADGAWHNIVATFNSPTMAVYKDGVFVTSTTFAGGSFTADRPVKVADNIVFNPYIGKLCDVRIYSIALSGSDVTSIYAGNEPQSASRLLEWPPTEGSGTTVSDFTGNGNTLTFNAVAWSTDVPNPLKPPLTLTLTDSISSSDSTVAEDEKALSDSITIIDSVNQAKGQNVSDSMTITDSFSLQSSAIAPVSIPSVEVLTNELIPAEIKTYFNIVE